ncbi:hypothetical protein CR159_16320 [Pollutimonas subterranea]|uniref:Uncharacterized protein n=1 Tax=Pollutimonas subterranea TaxID=2045210 RepID=A0A2N4U116_9BURK|nr:hypothetical protein [Pollutimonas subterranea]PLC48712.1 hypothetical protein CR159_16320 [Pollutimonas subterranea]
MSTLSDNQKSLMQWLGAIPEHGKALGLHAICWNICFLLSRRTVSDVEAMRDVLCEHINGIGAGGWDYELPPPGFNWQLHGTVIWRAICALPEELKVKANNVENWELVAVVALHSVQQALASLWSEPIGLGVLPVTVSPESQTLVTSASQWYQWASREREAGSVAIGRKVKKGSEKGNASSYRAEQKTERRLLILREAKEVRGKNPKLSKSQIAKRIEGHHPGRDGRPEVGYGWRTVYDVLTEAPKK